MESLPDLPDDVWHKILDIGIETERLDHTDICSLAIVNSHFDQLTQNPVLWATLLSRDFQYSFRIPSKALYRSKHMTDRLFKHSLQLLRASILRLYASMLHNISYSSSLQSNSSQIGTSVTSGSQMNIVVYNPFVHDMDVLSLHEEPDPLQPRASQSNLRPAHKYYYESKSSKRFDKLSKLKIIPNSKSYIPMNRPPRRSMPRKI